MADRESASPSWTVTLTRPRKSLPYALGSESSSSWYGWSSSNSACLDGTTRAGRADANGTTAMGGASMCRTGVGFSLMGSMVLAEATWTPLASNLKLVAFSQEV